ncbi:molybdopterin-dependent oxidoreductase [Ruegeria sp. 1NDH52C]|uniref:Molybdopterin-dependent oxidoreductase n=1 Tax=Ruegeria alba TaxID=2916756 RepID=A0ABS9P029_9RHOB|nr:molybdopterin cofactor-binding domain-containing protein [Ruegeria alba]MCG6559464.1 molybdopterin-dependent oxidoreductase [Ruegeria alba]
MDRPLSTTTDFTLNGAPARATPQPGERLSRMLRERCGAREVKVGCDAGDCGACTVLVDGAPVCACLTPAHQVAGRRVDTLKGLATDPVAQKLSDSFLAHGAAQCGICTPGMMVAATALLRETPQPTEAQVQDALGGVLCRCTGYRKIIQAVMQAGAPLPTAPAGDGHSGAAIPRLDGVGKVAGTEAYGDDVAPMGTLEILLVGAPYPRAGFTLGDIESWHSAHAGVVAVLTTADVPGRNRFGVMPGFEDQPVFAETETRFRGEPVAAIVAPPEVAATLDLSLFPVTWTRLDAVENTADATAPGAPLLHPDRAGNVMVTGFVACGDAEAALAASDVVVEGRYATPFVEHAYIEPEAGYAYLDGDKVVVHACTQAPVLDRDGLQMVLGLSPDRIRIIPTGVGGGFGSKLDMSVQPYLAIAALKTGQPVRLAYSRVQSMQMSTKRHPSELHLRIGASADGRLKGFALQGRFNTGAYASWGPTVANRVPVHGSGPYFIRDYRAEAQGIHTHCPPSGAFRGFGVPQAAIAQETLFDELAEKLGMDPLDFRLKNALTTGQPTVCGQVFTQGVGIRACLEALKPDWTRERAAAEAFNAENSVLKRGVGIAAGWYGCGNTSLPNPSTIKCGIRADGTLVLHQGAMDIGQGANTVITQLFATALGIPTHRIELIGADTDLTPDAGKTSASRQTFVTGNAAKLAGAALRAAILTRVNAGPEATLTLEQGRIHVTDNGRAHVIDLSDLPTDADGYVLGASETYDPPTKPLDKNGQGVPYAQFGYAAHLALVEIDTRLGTIRPLRFTAAHDVGHAVNPALVEGQVEGGIAQGLGMALMEEYIPGRTDNLHDYLIPTIGDVPPIDTLIIEDPDEHGPYGAKGLGEHALIPTAPALLNAIRHATGVSIRQTPVTPARLRAALKEAGHD